MSKADPSHFIEIPNKNLTKSTNGGQHPWVLNKTTNSKVYLYNGTAETVNPTVRVYTGSQTWIMAIKLAPSETKTFDIRALFINKVKDSKGRILTGAPDNGIEGIVSWSSLKTKSLHGRVLQIDSATLTTRNFACDVVYIACGAAWDPFDFYTALQQTSPASGGANECPSVGACTCDGSSCPGGTLSEADSYYWFVYNTSVAPITSGTYSAQASLFGNSVGQTTLELGVGDSSGCSASGEGPVTVPGRLVGQVTSQVPSEDNSVIAARPFTMQVNVVDGNNNVMTNISGTAEISFSNPLSGETSDVAVSISSGTGTANLQLNGVQGTNSSRNYTLIPSGLIATASEGSVYLWFNAIASREGLVGQATAYGHIIQTDDHFVALPATGLNSAVVRLRNG